MRAIVASLGLVLLGSVAPLLASDWPRFRGPNGAAVSDETGLPVTWNDSDNIAWKAELPGPGSSSPIVSGGRVFVTCYSGYGVDRSSPGDPDQLKRHLLCFRLSDGSLLWERTVPAVLPEDRYQGMLTEHGYATHTPATDGERVYVFFGKSGVLAFDLEGNQIWQTPVGIGSAMMGWGSATSPIVYKSLVIVNANAESQSLVALDAETGHEVWKADAQGYAGSWSTPVVVAAEGKDELVVQMPDEVWGLDPQDGGLVWYCTGVRGSATTSLVASGGVVYSVRGGPGGSAAVAIRAGGRDDVAATHLLWQKPVGSYVPSPVTLGEYMYWTDDRGVACCLRTDSGEQVYRERLPGAGGTYASAVGADGKLYVVSRRNGTFVLAAGPRFRLLAQNRIDSDPTDFNASPAISAGRLLLRSNRFLYCIAAP